MVHIRRQAGAGNQSAQTPQATRLEAQDDQVAVEPEHAVNFPKYLVRPTTEIERVRQNKDVDGI